MTLAWDTETRSFRWWEPGTPFLASWDTGKGGLASPFPPHDEAADVQRYDSDDGDLDTFLEHVRTDKHHVGANTKFDAHMLREAIGIDILKPGSGYVVDDVLMMSRLLFGSQRASHGLKELARDFLDPEAMAAEEAMAARYHELTGRSDMKHDDAYYVTWKAFPDEVEFYARLDAEYTRRLMNLFLPKMQEDAKLWRLYTEVERPVQTVLYEAERIGTRVDPVAVERLREHYELRDTEARVALEATIGFVPEGEGSEERLRAALVDAGVPLTERTEKTGELAINRKALSPHADHPAVAALFEWRRVGKFLSTYINPLTGVDIVHPTFNQAQAWTGRMSGSNPNMQNLPKRSESTTDADFKVRSVFIPREGMEFIVADFESIEARILAHFLGYKSYQDEVANGDPHATTAAAAFGGTPPSYYKGTPQRWLRDIAKHTTYAIFFGGGGPVIRDTINRMVVEAGHPEYRVDLDQARAIRKKIAEAIPGFKDFTKSPYKDKPPTSWNTGRLYQQLLNSQQGEFGYVRTLLGRKQWIRLDKAYVALSGLIQGSAADVMKAAAIAVADALRPYGGYPLLFVHDELVAEVPLGWGERLKPIMVDAMMQAATVNPPLAVEASVTTRSYAHA